MANRKKQKRHVPTNHKLAAQFTLLSGKKKYRDKKVSSGCLMNDAGIPVKVVLPPKMNCVGDIIDDFQK